MCKGAMVELYIYGPANSFSHVGHGLFWHSFSTRFVSYSNPRLLLPLNIGHSGQLSSQPATIIPNGLVAAPTTDKPHIDISPNAPETNSSFSSQKTPLPRKTGTHISQQSWRGHACTNKPLIPQLSANEMAYNLKQ